MLKFQFYILILIVSQVLPSSLFGNSLDFDDTASPCSVDSNMAESYTYSYTCIPNLGGADSQCYYGGEHALDAVPFLMPNIAEVRLNASLTGYGEVQFSFDTAKINDEEQIGYNGASRTADIGTWGVNINVNDNIPDGTAFANQDTGYIIGGKTKRYQLNRMALGLAVELSDSQV